MTLRSIVVRPFAAGCLSAIILLTSLANPSLRAAEALDPVSIRKQFVLAQEPVGAISLATAKVKCSKAEAANPAIGVPIVIAGRIGARGIEPFLDKKASFVLIEIPADDHAAKPGHKDDDCPFCKKRNANSPMAAVQFLDKNGSVVPIDARTLFGLAKGRDVVVSGKGVFDPKLAIPIIQLTADGIFLRP
ncbi:MAG: hypothetical protein NTY87_03690 [Planctomycetia bacterium]|nr:hypothetical protein [Planctomycetia bacterium]RLT14072.1 MAG: hypothetical protein DWI25_05765 [Planctomycetota bacterium]